VRPAQKRAPRKLQGLLLVIGASSLAGLWSTAAYPSCIGDCNADAAVTVDEVIAGVNIDLGVADMSTCVAFDANGDGQVTVDEITAAVSNALNGCGMPLLSSNRSVPVPALSAAQPVIHVGSGSGSAGSSATFFVSLSAGGASVAGTQNDISFQPTTPVSTTSAGHCVITTTAACTTDADCPMLPSPFTGNEPCIISANAPGCSVNPAIGKGGFFSFLPSGCTPLEDCTAIRALIVAVDNLNAIPDGSTLYSCNVAISPGATAGDHGLTISNTIAGDTSQARVADVTGTDGKITVGLPSGQISVCDVAPSTGDDFGQFGNGAVNNADVIATFKASLLGPPPAENARFMAMDALTVDNPPVCGGNGAINNADVVACFKRSLLGGPNFVRTIGGGACASAPQ
jgi:hypothetical protein